MSTQRGLAPRWWALTVAGASLLSSPGARALDKQGSAHGGDVSSADSGFDLTGTASLGASLYNPTYAARPDNTGHALFRYAGHADIDLIGQRLSIPIDVNLFTDRDRSGAAKLVPSELDLIGGVTTTWGVGPGALEFGTRAETDRNLDRGNYSQTYVDARLRYLYSLADQFPAAGTALHGNVTGAATLGAFVVNPTYAARPDNSGIALLRYALHGEVSFLQSHAAIGLDGTMFTDRRHHPVTPSELDLTPELIGRLDPFELHLAYERDMPISEPALLSTQNAPHTQHFVYLLAAWSFDAYRSPNDDKPVKHPEPDKPPDGDTRAEPAQPDSDAAKAGSSSDGARAR
jgi:hypothetical protein